MADYIQIKNGSTNVYPNTAVSHWTYEELGSNSFGALIGSINEKLGMANITWAGNSTTPGTTVYQFDIPAKYKPKYNCVVVVRNGDSMEIRSDLHVNITLTGRSWSGSSFTYPLY